MITAWRRRRRWLRCGCAPPPPALRCLDAALLGLRCERGQPFCLAWRLRDELALLRPKAMGVGGSCACASANPGAGQQLRRVAGCPAISAGMIRGCWPPLLVGRLDRDGRGGRTNSTQRPPVRARLAQQEAALQFQHDGVGHAAGLLPTDR